MGHNGNRHGRWKAVVGFQSIAVTILGLALYNDYLHNVYLRIYVNGAIQQDFIGYEALLGLCFGMLLAFVATSASRKAGPEVRTKLGAFISAIRPFVLSAGTSKTSDENRGRTRPLSDPDNTLGGLPGLPLLGTSLD